MWSSRADVFAGALMPTSSQPRFCNVKKPRILERGSFVRFVLSLWVSKPSCTYTRFELANLWVSKTKRYPHQVRTRVFAKNLRGSDPRDAFHKAPLGKDVKVCSLVTPGQVKPKARVFEFFRLTLILRRRGKNAFRVFVFGRLGSGGTGCHASYKA